MSGCWDIPHLRNLNIKLWSNSTNKTESRTNKWKDENYISLGINAGGTTSESINLTLSWIGIQPFSFKGGWEELDLPILSPPWKDKASTLCSGYLGGENRVLDYSKSRLQKCRQICIFSMPLVFTGIYGIYGKYGGKYGIYGKFNGQLSNISVLNNTP